MSSHTSHQGHRDLPGSHRNPVAGARHVGPVDPNEVIEVSLYLRDPAGQIATEGGIPPRLSREEYASQHGAAPADIDQVKQFAQAHGLTVVDVDPVSRRVKLAGPVSAITKAFGTSLQLYEHEGRTFRGRSGPLQVPANLIGVVTSVLGLDNRPQAYTRLRYYDPAIRPRAVAANSFTPTQVAQLYNYPTTATGQGECVAIIELGGGYSQDDLTTYFQQLGVTPPTVISVGVDGADNQPGQDPNGADGEVELDVEVVGAVAPGAKIVVYFAPNTDQGFVDAINNAIHDTANKPSVISISWGGPESSWSDQAIQTMDQAFQAAASLGVTVCAAAGDNGSGDGVNDGLAHVDFPASDPYVLACGGTLLAGSGSQISSEVVWNESTTSATGGGVSDKFDLPAWQQNIGVPPSANADKRVGRGVPDVAGDADPQSGYQIRVDGQDVVIGGTSAVAPLWSALVALLNQVRGGQSLGYLNPTLYQNYQALLQDNAFHDITQGNNGAYSAGTGWDACTGLGSPNGSNLATGLANLAVQQAAAAGPSPS